MSYDRKSAIPPVLAGHIADRACIECIQKEIGTWLLTVDLFQKRAEECRDDPVKYARACAHAGAFTMAIEQLSKIIGPRATN